MDCQLILNDFNRLENKDKTADRILNDTRSNNKLLINFIDKAYGSKSKSEIVDHFQLQIKLIIEYWISVKHGNARKETNETDLSKVYKFLDGFKKNHSKINKKSVEVKPTHYR